MFILEALGLIKHFHYQVMVQVQDKEADTAPKKAEAVQNREVLTIR
jgi:hypothetical protein